jgi:electron transport complex protein RnfC
MIQSRTEEQARAAGKHIHHFHGGLHLRHNKKISCEVPVTRPALPDTLVVPLLQHSGHPAESLVQPGDRVLKGQLIGVCKEAFGSTVHAPTSGTVEAIEEHLISHPSGATGVCVVIRPDGHDTWQPLEPIHDWLNASQEVLCEKLKDCGVVGLGGAVFPTHLKSLDGQQKQVHTLILNGAECEPYISCDEMLMREQPEKIVLGARILRRALAAERVVIAIEDQMGAVFAALAHAAKQVETVNISVIKVAKIYPEGGERQLIQVLTGLEVPIGGRPSDLGLVCQNVATAAAAADAVIEGKPLIERYVTVTGNGIIQPRNMLALLGTPFYHLTNACGGYTDDVARLVVGGPMMGFPVSTDATPVVKAVNCILALTEKDIASPQTEMPCIRCGDCARACPAQLLPQQLHLQVTNKQWVEAEEYGLNACIECGCCDFVCPSHIPLTAWFRFGKGQLKQRAIDLKATEQARQRFEAREQRLLQKKEQRAERMAKRKQLLKDKAAGNKAIAPEDSEPDDNNA